jgi:Tol biopolymer transport system component
MSPGTPWRIYIISAEGGAIEPVSEEQRNQIHPSWSADGNSIVFSYLWRETVSPGIVIVNLRTHKTVRLPGSERLTEAAWSPDGRYIVARTLHSEALMLFDWKTQTWSELLRGEVGWTYWSTDGQYVYFKRFVSKARKKSTRWNGESHKISCSPDDGH